MDSHLGIIIRLRSKEVRRGLDSNRVRISVTQFILCQDQGQDLVKKICYNFKLCHKTKGTQCRQKLCDVSSI